MPETATTTKDENAGDETTQSGDGTEDPIESLAKEMGWQGKESFKGDDTNFVDAEEYIRKGQDIQDSMRKSLKDQKHQMVDMSGSLDELKQHNERVFKAEVGRLEKELAGLKAKKKTAIEEADVNEVDKIDEQIDAVKESIEPPSQTKQSVNSKFDEWVKDNDWYKSDKEMSEYADTVADKHEGAPFARVATMVEKQVKEMFPDKFAATKTSPSAPRVEAARKRAATSKFTKADLTGSQKNIMSQFIKQGIMSEKEYIADIAKLAGGEA